jgi:Tfp pilus assembly protein PilF
MEAVERKEAEGFLRELARNLCHIAEFFIKSKSYKEAKDVMLAAVLLDGDNVNCHTGLGVVYEYLEDKRSARKEFETAIALDPEFSPALAIMGEFCREAGEVDKAIQYFERDLAVLEFNHKDCSLRLIENLCSAYIAVGNRGKAKELMDRQIENHPGDENFLHLRDMLRLR